MVLTQTPRVHSCGMGVRGHAPAPHNIDARQWPTKDHTSPPPCNLPPKVVTVPPKGGGDGHKVTVPLGGGLHHTMVALNLQQFQCNRKTIFLRRLVLPILLGPSDRPSPMGVAGGAGGQAPITVHDAVAYGGWLQGGGGGRYLSANKKAAAGAWINDTEGRAQFSSGMRSG